MQDEVLITINYKNKTCDIAVSSRILVDDLIDIMTNMFEGRGVKARMFSQNHKKALRNDFSLSEEKIWDGDILSITN